MPTVRSHDTTHDVPAGTRLVHALEAMGTGVGHRCGGKARCTTCRVTFAHGEPDAMTTAEADKLRDQGLLGEVRLACQILVEQDMEVTPLMTVEGEGWSDPGPTPTDGIEPDPSWTTRDAATSD